jgi:AcrR family transcriptional regulator
MSHLDRKIRDKERIKESILTAARKIAKKEGWQNVTIRRIADEIEYTPPVIYEHFSGKEGIISELILIGFRLMRRDFDKVLESETDPREIILQFSLIHWDFAFANTDLYQLMFSLERPKPTAEMLSTIKTIENQFNILTNYNEELTKEIIFNWMCLNNGTISTVMLFNPHFPVKDFNPREKYINFIKRFLNSI